jgi:hypothetical protein
VDGDYTTIVNITNISEQPANFIVDIRFPSGHYFLPAQEVPVAGTATFDLRKLIAEQQPDNQGNLIPPSVKGGQFHWSVFGGPETSKLIGRSEVVSLSAQVSSSYSCPACCPDSGPLSNGMNTTGAVRVGGFIPASEPGYMADCNGYWTSMGDISVDGWWSQASYMAAVNPSSGSSTQIEGMSPGDTMIQNTWWFYQWDPGPDDCYRYSFTGGDSAPVTVVAPITVTVLVANPLVAVGKDQTAPIDVTIPESPVTVARTLRLVTLPGTTGQVLFSDGASEKIVTGNTVLELRGVAVSSTANNIQLQVLVNGAVTQTFYFTCVQVTLTFRTGSDKTASLDNAAREQLVTEIGTLQLGPQVAPGGHYRGYGVTAVEIVGTVLPSNFGQYIILHRKMDLKTYNDRTLDISATNADDTSDPRLRDDDPRPYGMVYDLDGPGLRNDDTAAPGTIRRVRRNFKQWATILGQDNVRLSGDLEWFSVESVIRQSNGTDTFLNDVPGDNVAGTGSKPLTWNLQ